MLCLSRLTPKKHLTLLVTFFYKMYRKDALICFYNVFTFKVSTCISTILKFETIRYRSNSLYRKSVRNNIDRISYIEIQSDMKYITYQLGYPCLASVSPPGPPTPAPPHFYKFKSFFGNPEILFNLAMLHRGCLSLFPDKNFPVAAVPSLATKTFMKYI